jgi:hypothetical protein
MYDVTLRRVLSARVLWIASLVLVTLLPGCTSSGGPPKEPKVRIEGPAGTPFGYSVSYFDGKDDLDAEGTIKVIPESGIFSEDLKSGHQGVLVQVVPNAAATLTVILLDGSKEIQRASATGDKDTAEVKAGTVRKVGPFKRK